MFENAPISKNCKDKKGGGSSMTFRQKFSVSLPKNFPVEPFIVSRYRKIIFLIGLIHEFLWKFFCLTVP